MSKVTEKALRDSEEKFRTLFNNSDAAIFVQEMGRTEEPGQYIEINDTACKLWGYSREEFLKMTPRDIEDPESSIELPHVIEEFFQKGKCIFQRITIAKDGSYIPVEITAIKFYLQGRYVMASIVRDLRAIRESEEALKKSEAKYKNLFKNMHNAFGYFKVVYDRNKNIIDFIYLEVNNAYEKLVDAKREELVGKSFFQIFLDLKNYKELYLQIVANAVIESQPFESKEFFIGGNINKWCQVYIYSPEEDCFACIFRDTTEQKKNAEELREAKEAAEAASSAKSTFLANVSHEIRTPLNSIIGLVDLTLLTNLTEDQRDSLETVKHSANSLLLIINDILDFSKIEAGKMTVDRTPFNLRNLIESSIKIHQINVKDKNLILTWNMDANVPEEIIGDANKLEQVINNILGNAIKFTEEGRVILSVKVIENVENFVEIVFAITDTGIGIAEEDRIKLFKEFSQVDGSITRRYGGTGLGLIISKGLIKIMGGIIGVESQKDKGSTFYFTVKVQRTSVKAAQPKVNVNYNNESKLFYNEEIDKNFENSVKFLSGKYHKNEKMNSYSYEFTSSMKDKCKNNKPISDNNQLLEFTKGYVKEIKEALEEGNFLKAEKAAKQIKNISSCAGIKNIKMLAFAIELAVRRRDLEEGKKFLKKLEETY
ncbi:ATP-binding protein [Clostridium sp. CX1]|uniref:ATP-binding protein n=1 Tax=Clostridium sp. CX1 TaxID=2978346 RepID=UPI0021C22F7C|nr:ATP-binding protein [Clostridium sp. CX1]MCT8977425.1 ATP-binding protein [Clostridium sp. CX1]